MSSKSKIFFHDDRTDWIVSAFGKEVDFILRLKRSLKSKRKDKPISLKELAAISGASFTEASHKLYLANSRHAHRMSVTMANRHEYRDSYLYLHLCLEHLLKHLWVKLIYAYEVRFLEAMPAVQDGAGSDANFSHDMSFLMKALFKAVPELPLSTRARPILSSLALSKQYGGWASVRYNADPKSPSVQTDFQNYYQNLRTSFLPFVADLRKAGLLR